MLEAFYENNFDKLAKKGNHAPQKQKITKPERARSRLSERQKLSNVPL
jgi:hypothetical protein